MICVTTDADWANFKQTAKKADFAKKAGNYHASFTIPMPLLNSDTYELCLNLLHPLVEVYDRVRGIFFEVMDLGSFASRPFNNRRNGVLVVPIQWKVNRDNPIK